MVLLASYVRVMAPRAMAIEQTSEFRQHAQGESVASFAKLINAGGARGRSQIYEAHQHLPYESSRMLIVASTGGPQAIEALERAMRTPDLRYGTGCPVRDGAIAPRAGLGQFCP